ncbi:DUF6703 family protein [Actinoplanes couchii]|uniref:Uncharacterized protein n=1 Tax=Actinoplanes couchii TaxID=403638 RepID=A0ABQ3XQC4_9ACTN|nr:DUF6703 family protein [Actinoplanes couchii]MDR6323005.1 hypothetical protein [Actinoplanes couchii]GID60679.1 hypothetical protein Aco03nite_090830 [Actinoplanes couchii]
MTPPAFLHRLQRVNPTTAFVVALGWLLAGLLLPGIIGGLMLFVLVAALSTLTFTTWPVQSPITRVVRSALLLLLLAAAVSKIL